MADEKNQVLETGRARRRMVVYHPRVRVVRDLRPSSCYGMTAPAGSSLIDGT